MSLSTTATTALPLDTARASTKPFAIPRRPLKLFTAASLLCAGAYGILSEQQYVSSSNAVISAYVLDVRTPIEGTVTQLPRTPGTLIAQDQLLAHIENPLADHEHLDNLRTLEDVAQSTAAADQVEAQSLAAQRDALLARAAAHGTAVTSRLTLSVVESESTQYAAEAAWHQAQTELFRARQLHTAGILSNADYDRTSATESIARRTLEAQHAALRSLESQRLAAQHGLLAEPGTNNDVAYSRQRADEIEFKLTETRRSLAASLAQARQAHAAVLAETTRTASLRTVDLRSPVTGQIFEVHAMDGETAPLQSPILSLVDCSRQFLLVEIPQDRMPDIALGGTVHFKLTGESTEHLGQVQSITGDPQKETNHKYAAFPLEDTTEQLATVRVALTDSSPTPTCTIGRTARVLLPTNPTNRLTRTLRQYF